MRKICAPLGLSMIALLGACSTTKAPGLSAIGPLDSKLTSPCLQAPPLTFEEVEAFGLLAPIDQGKFLMSRDVERLGETKCERGRADGILAVIAAHDGAVSP